MGLFDRSSFVIDLKDLAKLEKLIDVIFNVYYKCGSCLITENDANYAMTKIFDEGLEVENENKQKLLDCATKLANTCDEAYLYYHGSAHARSIREMPQVNDLLNKFDSQNPGITKITELISSVIDRRISLDGKEILLSTQLPFMNNTDMFTVLKNINIKYKLTGLLNVKSKNFINFATNGHIFTLSSSGIRDGMYWQFDIDDGFYNVFGRDVPNEFKSSFEQWKKSNNCDKNPIFVQNIM